jgi:hypothetical protein
MDLRRKTLTSLAAFEVMYAKSLVSSFTCDETIEHHAALGALKGRVLLSNTR